MVKALMTLNSLCHHNFEIKTDINVKIGFYAKNFICRISDNKKTSAFTPLIMKRWTVIHMLLLYKLIFSGLGKYDIS